MTGRRTAEDAPAAASSPPVTPVTPVLALQLSIRKNEVLHFLGYPEGRRPAGRLAPLLDQALREARKLADARGAFRELPVSAAAGIGLRPERADALAIGLVTVGAGIERRVTELLAEGHDSRALLLDAAGSAAAEEAARRLSVLVVGRRTGGTPDLAQGASCRISPGYGRWPLTAQKALFEHLPHQELDVSLNSSMMMTPRKSISFALWIGVRSVPGSGLSGCALCGLQTCRYRQSAAAVTTGKRQRRRGLEATGR